MFIEIITKKEITLMNQSGMEVLLAYTRITAASKKY